MVALCPILGSRTSMGGGGGLKEKAKRKKTLI
jgi:hypothetical protein